MSKKASPPKSVDVGGGYKLHFRKRSLWSQIKPITKIGIPFFAGIVIGTFFLYRVSKGRYELRDRQRGAVSHDSLGTKTKEFSLEDEYEKMKQQIDLTPWESKRIPRPSEK